MLLGIEFEDFQCEMPQGNDSIDILLCFEAEMFDFLADTCFDLFYSSVASPVDLSGACVRKVALFTVAALLYLRVPAPESESFSLVALGERWGFLMALLTSVATFLV